jgi:single-stranded-DNA-specific exonuclease
MRWIKPSLDNGLAKQLEQHHGISSVAAALLVNRGFTDTESVEKFLSPNLQGLGDPLDVGNMREAVALVESALLDQQSIMIFGDYDVDGVTSTVFLTHFLRQFGLSPRFVVPKRLSEGYGLSRESLQRALADGKPDLLIAVDCGTSSHEEIAWLREQGIKVLILDHHTSKESLPDDCVLVNPHVHDEDSVPWKNLCSVGLVFKFCHAFLKVMRQKGDALAEQTDLKEYLDLVAMGTVADLVPLEGENRILVKHGLKRLQRCRRPGICALMEVAGITLGDDIAPFDIGFKLGPRINASGRLSDAALPIQLLLNDDWNRCNEAARALDSYNMERQDIERAFTESAEQHVESDYTEDLGLVLHESEWHAGVVGIVASRISRKFHRPALILGSDADGQLKGSGRSIEGVNLVEILKQCSDSIVQWGGHPMAVGLSVEATQVENLRAAFNQALKDAFPSGLPESTLKIDAVVNGSDLTEQLLQELECLTPYGQGNPEPVFMLEQVTLQNVYPLGDSHFKFQMLRPGCPYPLEGVAWGLGHKKPEAGIQVDILAKYHWHAWRGRRGPRLTMLDWR